MSFLDNIKEFFSVAKETNFDLFQIYSQTPNGVYSVLLILVILLFVVVFLIRRVVKISSAVKLVDKIQNSDNFDDYDSKLTKLVSELPKRGIKVAENMNLQKEEILKKELDLIKDFNIEEKINKYQQISSQYNLIAQNSKKYKIDDLTSYYEEKSTSLLKDNLNKEIESYYTNAQFNEDDVSFVNSIVKYANNTNNVEFIIKPLLEHINSFSYGYNLNLYKFIKKLDKNKSMQVFDNCTEKFDNILNNEKGKISELILTYMLENDEKEKVYNYITNLKDENHLKSLYDNLFAKTENIDLDLSFVANETKIDSNYANHLDNELTNNWKDLGYINHIMNAPKVLETIGHISYRNVLERIERLEKDEKVNKAVSEALSIARRAESIATEAKALVSK